MLKLQQKKLSWAAKYFLDGNAKKHDIGSLYQSIKRYGFRDPLGYDEQLNGGRGGIVEGNGRLETLVQLYQEDRDNPPAGIAKDADGDWLVPIIFGCDSKNEQEAIAYSLDHNLTMLKGGERSPYDILSQDFDIEVFDILSEQFDKGYPTVAIDGDDLDSALKTIEIIDNQSLDFGDDGEIDETQDMGGNRKKFPLAIALEKEDWEDWNSFKESVGLTDDLRAFQRLLGLAQDRGE